MSKVVEMGYSRVVRFPRSSPMPPKNFSVAGTDLTGVAADLTRLREELESLIAELERAYGGENQVTLRAEQVSGALQRLEWALERQRPPARMDSSPD